MYDYLLNIWESQKELNTMDERSQLPYYGKKGEHDEFCKFCLQVLMRKTQKTLARCPNCGEPFYEN